MHTCLDQYNANKANNANGGLVWKKKAAAITASATGTLKAEVKTGFTGRTLMPKFSSLQSYCV